MLPSSVSDADPRCSTALPCLTAQSRCVFICFALLLMSGLGSWTQLSAARAIHHVEAPIQMTVDLNPALHSSQLAQSRQLAQSINQSLAQSRQLARSINRSLAQRIESKSAPAKRTARSVPPICVDVSVASQFPVDDNPKRPACVWARVGDTFHEQRSSPSGQSLEERQMMCSNNGPQNKSLSLTLLHRAPIDDQFACYPFSGFTFSHAVDLKQEKASLRMRELVNLARICDVSNKSLNLVVLGGSVAGGGDHCTDPANTLFHRSSTGHMINTCSLWGRFRDWLAYRYPHCEFVLHNFASPGTTSAWRAAHIGTPVGGERSVLEVADAVFIDYAANDMIINADGAITSQDDPFAAQRAALEVLMRRLFLFRAENPPVVVIWSALRRLPLNSKTIGCDPELVSHMNEFQSTTLDADCNDFQQTVYAKVAEHYDAPLISFRDVVVSRGRNATPPRMWNIQSGVHPDWVGHQLMADVLSYAWALQESFLVESPQPPSEKTYVVPKGLAFASPESRALLNCQRLLTDHGGGIGSVYFTPQRVDPGWRYILNGTKSGWEFDVSEARHSHWIGCYAAQRPLMLVTVAVLAVATAAAAAAAIVGIGKTSLEANEMSVDASQKAKLMLLSACLASTLLSLGIIPRYFCVSYENLAAEELPRISFDLEFGDTPVLTITVSRQTSVRWLR